MKRSFLIFLSLASALLLFFAFKDPAVLFNVDSMRAPATSADASASAGTWQSVIQYSYNGYFSWRADPWVSSLSRFVASAASPNAYQLSLLVILWIGSVLLFKTSLFVQTANALSASSVLVAGIGFVVDGDTVVLGTLCWVPFLILALNFGRRNGDFLWIVVFALFGLRASCTANHTVLLTFAIAFAISAALEKSEITTPHRTSNVLLSARNRRIVHRGCLLLALSTYVYFLSAAQQATFPDYPGGARLVALDGIPGMARPLVGADTPLAVINSSAVKSTSLRPSLLLGLFSLALFVYWRRRSLSAAQLFGGATCVSAAAYWDCVAAKSFASIGPLAAIARLFPNCSLVPLAPIAVGAAEFFLVCGLVLEFGRWRYLSPCVSIAIFSFAAVRSLHSTTLNAAPAGVTVEDISTPNWIHTAEYVPGAEAAEWQHGLAGPSRLVSRFFGRSALAQQYAESFRAPKAANELIRKVWASVHAESAPLLADGDSETRYTTHTGGQKGGETLVVWLTKPVAAIGVQLSVGQYVTDFPRGISIRGGTDCSENAEETAANAPMLARFPTWQGPPDRAPDQSPFFGGQADVRVPFDQPSTVSCLRIVQLGKDAQFDWSVAELTIIPRPAL